MKLLLLLQPQAAQPGGAPSVSPSSVTASTGTSPPIPQSISACGNSSGGVGNGELPPAASSPLGGELDRRASSIAALRLKAREHELRIEMMRKSGTDLLS